MIPNRCFEILTFQHYDSITMQGGDILKYWNALAGSTVTKDDKFFTFKNLNDIITGIFIPFVPSIIVVLDFHNFFLQY